MADRATKGGDCPFCRIARGEDGSVELVGEGLSWVAFFPLEPATPGHTLVVPRDHLADYWQLGQPLAAEIAVATLRVGNAVHEALRPEGMNLITSSGAAAEQTVMHAHLHVVPRWRTDPIGPIWPPKERMDPTAKHYIAAKIRDALRGLA